MSISGRNLPGKKIRETQNEFAFRVKMGEYELEINGSREEVIRTIEDLPNLISYVHKSFENIKPKTVTTLTVKTGAAKDGMHTQKYPKISPVENCDDAIIRILETDWGKWRPRTIEELKEALQANSLNHSIRTLTNSLMELVKKGKIRRWNTDDGFVYILVEKETLGMKGEAE